MSNIDYNNIKIPNNIDDRIKIGIEKAILEKEKTNRIKKNRKVGTIAASLIAILTLGITNPALATKIPIIGSVFEVIEKNIYFPGEYSQYATSVNEVAYSNGIGITLSEILCDGQSLYITYIVENEEPFKYTSWGESGLMDMNQLLTNEAYNKVDFTDKELDNTGFSGLEGKFIDENTFIGVQQYHLSTLETKIPDEFTFQTKISVIQNYGVNDSDKDYTKLGTWAFKVPVKVNRDLRRVVNLDNVENGVAKINSLSITPFDMIVDISYKEGLWNEYRTNIYDENGEMLELSIGKVTEDSKGQRLTVKAPQSESKSIRVIVENKHETGTNLDEVSNEVVFDKIIPIK